ncbi:low molecular weight protein tyrosine phosphatase family protein [soil metagenome]
MKLLFVCSRNRLRSPTAEHLFGKVAGFETQSAGTAADAETRLCTDQIEWADIVFVMEPIHRKRMSQAFGKSLRDKRVVCLNIPDDFEYDDLELVRLLWDRVSQSVPELLSDRPD